MAGWHGEERHAQPGVDAEREGEARKGDFPGGRWPWLSYCTGPLEGGGGCLCSPQFVYTVSGLRCTVHGTSCTVSTVNRIGSCCPRSVRCRSSLRYRTVPARASGQTAFQPSSPPALSRPLSPSSLRLRSPVSGCLRLQSALVAAALHRRRPAKGAQPACGLARRPPRRLLILTCWMSSPRGTERGEREREERRGEERESGKQSRPAPHHHQHRV